VREQDGARGWFTWDFVCSVTVHRCAPLRRSAAAGVVGPARRSADSPIVGPRAGQFTRTWPAHSQSGADVAPLRPALNRPAPGGDDPLAACS